MSDLLPRENPFADRIQVVRGLRVMLDADLAELYGVPTRRFNEQVKRNIARFPVEFMFQLTAEEFRSLRSQIATSKNGEGWSQLATTPPGRGGRRHAPYAFTEHGAIMAATILNSPKAVDVGAGLPAMKALPFAGKPAPTCTRKVSSHDQALAGVIDAIRQLTAPPNPKKRAIGFVTDQEDHA